MTEQERMKAGYLWLDDEENMALQARAKGLVEKFNALPPEAMEERMALNQDLFGSCGKNVWIVPPMKLAVGKYISIGEGCYFNAGTTFIEQLAKDAAQNPIKLESAPRPLTAEDCQAAFHEALAQYWE